MPKVTHILSSKVRASVLWSCALIVMCLGTAQSEPDLDDSVVQGKFLATQRSKGNCLACHMFDDGELPGDLGPPLLAMKARFPIRAKLRNQICDATVRNRSSRMPPFCRHGILTVAEVELIIDYLYTL